MKPTQNRATEDYFKRKIEGLNHSLEELNQTSNPALKAIRSILFSRKFDRFLQASQSGPLGHHNYHSAAILALSKTASEELTELFFSKLLQELELDQSRISNARFRNQVAINFSDSCFAACLENDAELLDTNFFTKVTAFRKATWAEKDETLSKHRYLPMIRSGLGKNSTKMLEAIFLHLKKSDFDKDALLKFFLEKKLERKGEFF